MHRWTTVGKLKVPAKRMESSYCELQQNRKAENKKQAALRTFRSARQKQIIGLAGS